MREGGLEGREKERAFYRRFRGSHKKDSIVGRIENPRRIPKSRISEYLGGAVTYARLHLRRLGGGVVGCGMN